jgi:hypothetical protein
VTLSLKPESLKRYKDIIALLIKYGRSDLVKQAGLDHVAGDREQALQAAAAPKAEELASDLEKLGPTFIKLGQFLSTRADLLPEPYLGALARLQDQIESFSFDEAEQIVSSELGVRIPKALPNSKNVRIRQGEFALPSGFEIGARKLSQLQDNLASFVKGECKRVRRLRGVLNKGLNGAAFGHDTQRGMLQRLRSPPARDTVIVVKWR